MGSPDFLRSLKFIALLGKPRRLCQCWQTWKSKPSVHQSGEAEAASMYLCIESPVNTGHDFKGEKEIHIPVPCHLKNRLWVREEPGRISPERRQLLAKLWAELPSRHKKTHGRLRHWLRDQTSLTPSSALSATEGYNCFLHPGLQRWFSYSKCGCCWWSGCLAS